MDRKGIGVSEENDVDDGMELKLKDKNETKTEIVGEHVKNQFFRTDFPKNPDESLFFKILFPLVWVFETTTIIIFKSIRKSLNSYDIPAIDSSDHLSSLESRFDEVWDRLSNLKGMNLRRFKLLWALLFGGARETYFYSFVLFSTSAVLEVVLPLVMKLIFQSLRPVLTSDIVESTNLARSILPEELKPPTDLYATGLFRNNDYVVYLYLLLFSTMKIVQVVCNQNGVKHCFRGGIRMKSLLTTKIYQKSLRLSHRARLLYPKGTVISLISVDIARITWIGQMLFTVTTSFLFTSIPMGFILVSILSPLSALTGLATSIFLIPVCIVFFLLMHRVDRRVVRLKDRKMSLINEFLQGIRIVKLFAWESFHVNRIQAKRNEEVKGVRMSVILRAIAYSTIQLTPIIMAVTTFSVLMLTEKGLVDPVSIFVSLTYFSILQNPISYLPDVIVQLANLAVSLKRIQDFLHAEEIEEVKKSSGEDDEIDVSVSIKNADFEWISSTPKIQTTQQPQQKKKNEDSNNNRDSTESHHQGKLSNITVKIKKGAFVVVIGASGSGKSSFLHAILGNMKRVRREGEEESHLFVNERIAYAGQTPFIFNDSLWGNITLRNGVEIDEEKFAKVVSVAQLNHDLRVLKAGRNTEIGERGINLSGGQKARVAVARACYSDSELYLFDDVLAAVDAHVSKALIEDCLLDFLKNKTRILCTHSIHILPRADSILYFEKGSIVERGTYEELMSIENGIVRNLVKEHTLLEEEEDEKEEEISLSDAKNRNKNKKKKGGGGGEEGDMRKGMKDKLIKDEDKSSGNIRMRSLFVFLRNMGWISLAIVLSFFLLHQLVLTFNYWWLSSASSQRFTKVYGSEFNATFFDDVCSNKTRLMFNKSYWECENSVDPCVENCSWIMVDIFWNNFKNESLLYPEQNRLEIWEVNLIYFGVALGIVLFQFCKEFLCLNLIITSAERLHKSALRGVSSAPSLWYDETPIGRILSRFSDVEQIQKDGPRIMQYFTTSAFGAIGIIFVVIVLTRGIYLSVFWIIFVLNLVLFLVYRKGNIEMTRCYFVSNSPIYAHFEESINGIETIRAYARQKSFTEDVSLLVDTNIRIYYWMRLCYRWVEVRADFIGVLTFVVIAMLCIISLYFFPESELISFSDANMMISISYSLIAHVDFMMRSGSFLESLLVPIERLNQYGEKLPKEKPGLTKDVDREVSKLFLESKKKWPWKGKVVFQDYSVKYRPDLPLVLRGINVVFHSKCRVGVCGRTGSGKSTLVKAIFRIVEPSAGKILIDDVDISKVGLFELRTRLAMIPQDPWLMSGTVRSNLDAMGKYSDSKLWEALQKTFMKDAVLKRATQQLQQQQGGGHLGGVSSSGGLDVLIDEGGANWSVGERQLLCAARALLKNSRILILDECTANVDSKLIAIAYSFFRTGETDQKIQDTLRSAFRNCTQIIIAHRLNTIIDCDRILVMDDGEVVEYGSPYNLLNDPKYTLFSELVKETGAENAAFLRECAEQNRNDHSELMDTLRNFEEI